MKCEKCARELIGDSVVCAVCGHSSAPRASDESRAGTSPGDRQSATGESEANLIRFPASSDPPFSSVTKDDPTCLPTWRTEVRERARQYFQQRAEMPEVADILPEDELQPQNPIVEAALKRLQKTAESEPGQSGRPLAGTATARLGAGRHAARDISAPLATGRGISQSGSGRQTAELAAPKGSRSDARHLSPPYASTNVVSVAPTDKAQTKSGTAGLAAETVASHLPQPLSSPVSASLWERTLAGLFDNALIGIACVPLYSIHSITGLKYARGDAYTMLCIAVWITFLYLLWTTLVARRTCGMAWRHLRVADAETHDFMLPPSRIFVWSICATFSMLFPPVNLVVIWLSDNRSSLADMLSGTTILQTHSHAPQAPAKPS